MEISFISDTCYRTDSQIIFGPRGRTSSVVGTFITIPRMRTATALTHSPKHGSMLIYFNFSSSYF